MYIYVNHAYIYNWIAPSCYLTTGAQNDCYNEVTAYTVLAYCYWVSFHDVYGCLCHAHYQYRPQLPNKGYRTHVTNHIGSISCHIIPLVIHSVGGGHTHTHTIKHTYIQTFADRSNSKKPGVWRPSCTWFKNVPKYLSYLSKMCLMHTLPHHLAS